METRAGDPGAFAHFDLNRVDSPAFVVDAARLRANLAVLADIRDRAGVKVLAALKAFSMWKVAPVVGEYLDGVCTSGLWEAKLAAEHYVYKGGRGEIATYCAAYKAADIPEILRLSDHVIFNSPGQHARFAGEIVAARAGRVRRLMWGCGSTRSTPRAKCRATIRARRIHGWGSRSISWRTRISMA
ncbi:MAG: hypothetical protein NVS3B27_07620 [Novosphingobium sp.]